MVFLTDNILLQAPEYLWAILAVPLLWWLLRLIPPEAIRRRFPSLKLLQNLPPLRAQTAFTPIWLLILRGILIITLVLAFTDPVWQIDEADLPPPDQPIIFLIDNCWAAAPNWPEMQNKAQSLLSTLPLQQNIAILAACPPTANHLVTQGLVNSPGAILQMQQLQQQNAVANWRDIILALQNLDLAPIAQVHFISSGVMDSDEDLQRLSAEIRIYDDVNVILPPPNHLPLNLTISQKNPVTVTLQRLTDRNAASYRL
ncbi:MAG TPA: BatA domain-containing protein, partial [Alphaproteobacteria bacterium]|nr:BatA domain-containing protein [Alphaproteobacteria bacterium]